MNSCTSAISSDPNEISMDTFVEIKGIRYGGERTAALVRNGRRHVPNRMQRWIYSVWSFKSGLDSRAMYVNNILYTVFIYVNSPQKVRKEYLHEIMLASAPLTTASKLFQHGNVILLRTKGK